MISFKFIVEDLVVEGIRTVENNWVVHSTNQESFLTRKWVMSDDQCGAMVDLLAGGNDEIQQTYDRLLSDVRNCKDACRPIP